MIICVCYVEKVSCWWRMFHSNAALCSLLTKCSTEKTPYFPTDTEWLEVQLATNVIA